MTLPMAVLVAVLYAFSHLAADNEVTAMKRARQRGRAAGAGARRRDARRRHRALVDDQLLPRSNHRLRTLLVDIQRKKPTFQLKEQVINEIMPGQFSCVPRASTPPRTS